MDTDNITFGVDGSPLCMLRSDQGDGGWSLHTPEQIADSDVSGDPPATLLSGPATYSVNLDDWDRPNAADIAEAMAKINR